MGSVRASFGALGAFWGSWAVAIADVQRSFHLSDTALGVLLAVAIAVAGLGGAVAGHLAEHASAHRFLALSLLVWSVLMAVAAAARSTAAFAVAFTASEIAAGAVDTAMNAAATQHYSGEPGRLVRFHALFNAGALAGAAATGIAIHAGVSWRWLWPALGGSTALLGAANAWGAWGRRAGKPRGAPQGMGGAGGRSSQGGLGAAEPRGPLARLRHDRLVALLVVFVLAEVAEGGVDTWGVLYLRTRLAGGVLLGAGAYAVGQGVAALTRTGGGGLIGRLPPRLALVVGGCLAGGGIVVESRSPVALAAGGGLAVAAAGASLFWPLVMIEAVRRTSAPTATVGAFTAAGYVGWVAGAPVVGWVSGTWGLGIGLLVLAATAFGVAALAALSGRGRAVGPAVGPAGPGGPADPGRTIREPLPPAAS